MLTRTQKQLLISGVYVLIAAVIAGGIYWNNYRPTCSDGIKNDREEGVDCGTLACGKACAAPVQALVVQDVRLIRTPAGDSDMFTVVYNPNVDHGAGMVNYDLVITDSNGEVRRSGNFYILPGQTKYLVLTSLMDIPDNAQARLEIQSVEWIKASAEPEVYLVPGREAYTPGTGQSVYEVVISNRSNYDFDTVDVLVVVEDASGNVIATNMSNLKTFLSQTERSVKMTWPFALPSDARILVQAGTNVFDNANYLQQRGVSPERFQQYY